MLADGVDEVVGVLVLRQHAPAMAERAPCPARLVVDHLEPLRDRMVDRLGRGERAHAVHEATARADEFGCRTDDLALEAGQVGCIGRGDAPARVGSRNSSNSLRMVEVDERSAPATTIELTEMSASGPAVNSSGMIQVSWAIRYGSI